MEKRSFDNNTFIHIYSNKTNWAANLVWSGHDITV